MDNRIFGVAPRHNTLGDLPANKQRERSHAGKRIHNPGTHYVSDWINRNTLSLFPFTTDIVAQLVLPANELRTYLIIQNKSGGTLFVNFGQNPTQFASIQIPAGGNYELSGGATGGAFSPSDTVNVLGSIAGLDGVAGEGLWTPEAI